MIDKESCQCYDEDDKNSCQISAKEQKRGKTIAIIESFKRASFQAGNEPDRAWKAGRSVQTDDQPDRERGLFPVCDLRMKVRIFFC